MIEDYKLIRTIGQNDANVLEEKGRTYGDSWRKRGGAGAFMMLARKWDRIENIAQGAGYDIFKVGADNTGDILDDIADLRRYLLLVEAHIAGAKAPATPAPASKPIPVCPECRKGVLSDSTVVYRKGECPIHDEEDCGPGAGYVNQDGPQISLSWKGALATLPPTVGQFDVIQVRWKDGTHSAMLPHEFGKIAEWSEVEMYRIIRDGTNPEDCPLPEPVRRWGGEKCLACQGTHPKGAQCPNLTPHAGSHQHTISTGPAQTPYSHASGVGIVAGIASAVSGINAAIL